jgi:hypothetical protein
MKKEDIYKSVNEKIESGKIKMKSPMYFNSIGIIGIIGVFLLFLFTAFFVNTQFHAFKQHMALNYLTSKGYGFYEFIMRAPLINFLIGFVFLLLLVTLFLSLKNYYRLGRLKVLILFFVIAGILGFLINMTGVNEIFEADPYLNHLYLFKGTNDERFLTGRLETSGRSSAVLVTEDTSYVLDLAGLSPRVLQNLRLGECVTGQGNINGLSFHVEVIYPSSDCNFPR